MFIGNVVLVFALGYITALLEAVTIASVLLPRSASCSIGNVRQVPYYVIEDRKMFYIIGSAFYGVYFYVSFPMYFRYFSLSLSLSAVESISEQSPDSTRSRKTAGRCLVSLLTPWQPR